MVLTALQSAEDDPGKPGHGHGSSSDEKDPAKRSAGFARIEGDKNLIVYISRKHIH